MGGAAMFEQMEMPEGRRNAGCGALLLQRDQRSLQKCRLGMDPHSREAGGPLVGGVHLVLTVSMKRIILGVSRQCRWLRGGIRSLHTVAERFQKKAQSPISSSKIRHRICANDLL